MQNKKNCGLKMDPCGTQYDTSTLSVLKLPVETRLSRDIRREPNKNSASKA